MNQKNPKGGNQTLAAAATERSVRLARYQVVPVGVSGHQTPLGCVCRGTGQEASGLTRGLGNSWVVPAVPMARSNHGKLRITGSWGIPDQECKQGMVSVGSSIRNTTWHLLGSALCVTVHVGRAAHSPSCWDALLTCSSNHSITPTS